MSFYRLFTTRLLYYFKLVAYAPNSLETPLIGYTFELFSETLHVNVNSTGVSEVVKAPYLIKKRISCEYAVEVEREEVEKLKFLRRNVYSLTVKLKLVFFTAYLNVFKLDRLVVILVVVARNNV